MAATHSDLATATELATTYGSVLIEGVPPVQQKPDYAQARYLLYYLQEQGLFMTFYHEFCRAAQDDPMGYETLCKVLSRTEEDMEAFQKEWTEYVLALRF